MKVKFRGLVSKPRSQPGSGAQGASLGNHEFLSQTNNNADSIPPEDRFKFVDDLTALEKINLLSIGLASYNFKQHVASDIPTHGQFIDNSLLMSQQYLDRIKEWTINQKMVLNEDKTKAMLVNFTHNHQFTTRINLNGKNIDVVNQMKILGTIITNKISWNENCNNLVRKANARMQLLRKIWSFGSTIPEMVELWKVFCRGILEQTCPLWDSSLTDQNISDLERV